MLNEGIDSCNFIFLKNKTAQMMYLNYVNVIHQKKKIISAHIIYVNYDFIMILNILPMVYIQNKFIHFVEKN